MKHVCLSDPSSCVCLLQLPVQCCAAGMASTPAAAASATAGGKALSVTCQPTSALTSTVEDTASALWAPASAIPVIRAIIVRKVSFCGFCAKIRQFVSSLGFDVKCCCSVKQESFPYVGGILVYNP